MVKKGDLSINTIVIAIIAVLVLVLLILILTGKIDWFQRTTNDCENLKGECTTIETCQANDGSNMQQLNCDEGLICCQLPSGG